VHALAHANANLLLSPPWALALVVPALRVFLGKPSGTSRWELVLLAGSLLALPLALLLGQDNLRGAALLVPVWAGVWLGARVTDYQNQRSSLPLMRLFVSQSRRK
jgi:uncharacterized membrane protein YfcA